MRSCASYSPGGRLRAHVHIDVGPTVHPRSDGDALRNTGPDVHIHADDYAIAHGDRDADTHAGTRASADDRGDARAGVPRQ